MDVYSSVNACQNQVKLCSSRIQVEEAVGNIKILFVNQKICSPSPLLRILQLTAWDLNYLLNDDNS